MNRTEAGRVMKHLVSAQKELNAAVSEVEKLGSNEAAESLRRTLANVIGAVAADAIAPIVAVYPEMGPYGSDG
jgi:hypothetical protein